MRYLERWVLVLVIVAALPLSACGGGSEPVSVSEPATVEHLEGSEFSRVTLSARAADRLGIETASVRDAPSGSGGAARKVVPYAAVLYGTDGATWVYTNPERLVFVRDRIEVDYIEGNRAVLTDGPSPGTAVVTVGAAELLGTEFEVDH